MKKQISLFSLFLLSSLFLALFSVSCKHSDPQEIDPQEADTLPVGYGRIAVCYAENNSDLRFTETLTSTAFSARTAFPHADFDSYVFTFTKEGATSGTELTPDNSGYFTLEVGDYTVELQALIGGTIAASGVSDIFTVYEGDNDPVVVYLSPIPGAAQGTFTYTVTYPAGAEAVITLQKWDNSLDIPLSPTALSAGNGVTETLNLDASSYLLTILLSKNGSYAGTTEAVHVYQLLTTEYTKHFTDDDFIAPPANPTDPETPVNSPIQIIHYWIDQHDSLITTKSAATVAAGETLAINAQGGDAYTVRQWFLNGSPTGQTGSTFNFSSNAMGNHVIGLVLEKNGKLYNTNITINVTADTVIIPEPDGTRLITIDMFDSGGNGWDGSGAIKINVNGTEIAKVKVNTTGANNTPANQRDSNTYVFPVSSGDLVELIWVSGSSQNENSFIVYYTDTPPIPSFNSDTTNWNGSNALIYKLRGTINTATTLNPFTVQ